MNGQEEKSRGNAGPRLKKILLTLAGLSIGVLFSLPYLLLRKQIQVLPALGYLGVIALCAISNGSLFLPTSSTLIVLTAATVLNPFLCILAGGAGTAAGEQVSYLCGRIGLSWVERDAEKESRVMTWLNRNNVLTVFLFALLPLPIFDIVGLAAGATRMNWFRYALAAVAGKTLKFAITVTYVLYVLPHFLGQLPAQVQTFYESLF